MYNPYGYPAGYGPQGPQFGAFTPSPMPNPSGYQNAMQAAPAPAPAPGMPAVMQVATLDQVEHTQVPAGQKALVLVGNAPVIAMRAADNMGITATDYYRIEKFDPQAAAATPAPGADFVTRAELQHALEQFAQQLPIAAPASAPAANTEKEAAKK